MGVKEGLLALLAVGPRHGYQLKLDLESATADGNVVNVGQVYTTLQRLEREIDRTQARARGCQSVVNVRCFRFTLECSFEHLLRGHILAAIQFDDAAIVKRVSIAR